MTKLQRPHTDYDQSPRLDNITRRYPDTLHVDSLIGADTVNTLPEPTIAAYEDHGTWPADRHRRG